MLGKSLAGGLPLSAVLGSPELMSAWPPSEGAAIHTSTFLGNPVACAAALAQLRSIEDCMAEGRATCAPPPGLTLSPEYARRWALAPA